MRILIFSLAYFPFVGGAEVAIKEITDRLPKHEFVIVSANVRSFWPKYFYPFWAVRHAIQLHEKKSFDLIWAMMANQAGMAAASFKKSFPEVPFLLSLQEGDDFASFGYAARLLGPRLFRVFQRADYCQAISHYLAKWGHEMGFRGEVTVVPNGVDLEKVKSQKSKAKSESQKEKVIITTSRLVEKNGVGDLIKSLKFLPDSVGLWIIGGGPEEFKLKQAVSGLHLTSRVNFFGHVGPEEIPDYLAQADIFCRPSLSEGLGISFLEAMGAGLPTIGTAVGGIPDFLRHHETGWICEVKNPKSIAEQVKFIIDPANRTKVEEITTRARKLVAEKYNWDTIAQDMDQIFQKAKI